jgi:threonine aldolase
MRQSGVLAAPALVSLRDIAGKLYIDHQNARHLAGKI